MYFISFMNASFYLANEISWVMRMAKVSFFFLGSFRNEAVFGIVTTATFKSSVGLFDFGHFTLYETFERQAFIRAWL